ncbi:MAG: DUF262 domain-containing protein [Candidatus Faecimonas sp.]|nr:DUF262 domain-containing protein [Candidatus Faecimonas sp.]
MAKFEVNNVSVSTLLGYVKDGTIAIPEIQRPFVWDTTQVRDLIDSLYREYPVGYIITWKSPDVKLKDGTSSEGKQILIDGQQRVTALTAALLGQEVLDDNYKKRKIKIAFNIQTEEFQTNNPAIEKQEEWISDISEFMRDDFNTFDFISEYSKKFGMDANIVSNRVTKLRSIKNVSIGRIELGSALDIDVVTEIFVRINSKGVVLSQADFAMSKISVNEEYNGNDIRKAIDYFCHFAKTPVDFDNIKENDKDFSSKDIFNKITWIKDNNDDLYLPSYVDVLRVAFTYKFKRGKLQDLVSLLSGRDFETREYREDVVAESYSKLYDGVRQFVNQSNFERYVMILKSAGIIDGDLVRSQNVLNFGYILYLLLREKNVSPDKIETLVRRWVIMSIITQRYTSSPESQFDLDIRRLNESEDIIKYISDEEERRLGDTFWDNILVENFNTSVASSPYWKTFIIAQIKLNNRAFLSKDIDVRTLIEGRGDVHHIFPKDYLQKNGKDNRSIYNQIANFAMLQTEVNIQIGKKAPNDYMKSIIDQCNGQENKYGAINTLDDLYKNMEENCIPRSFVDMTIDNYEEFLKERRKLMAQKLKQYYESL